MSDDNTFDEEMEQVDVLSLMASESQEDDEDEVDEDTEDVDVLKERVSKRNKSLKKSKQAIHRLQEENDALMERLDRLEGQINSNKGQDTAVDPAKLEQEAQEWMDRVADDPVNAIKYADWKQSQLEQGLSNWAQKFEDKMMQKLNALDSATNPERIKYESEIGILKQRPEFKDMADEQLIPFAKMLKETKVSRPRSPVGGQRAEAPEKKFELTPEQKAAMGF